MLPELEPYFAKYYDRWLDYSRHICYCLGIRNEAYDVMADVLVDFCCKSDEALADLLNHEQQGERKLFFSSLKSIRFRAIKVIKKRHIATSDITVHLFHLAALEDEPNEISNEEREAEAVLRDDSFVIPVATSADPIVLSNVFFNGHIDKRTVKGKASLRVVYRAVINAHGKRRKQITRTSRGATMAAMIQYQMQHRSAL